jgi:hypothetical protein
MEHPITLLVVMLVYLALYFFVIRPLQRQKVYHLQGEVLSSEEVQEMERIKKRALVFLTDSGIKLVIPYIEDVSTITGAMAHDGKGRFLQHDGEVWRAVFLGPEQKPPHKPLAQQLKEHPATRDEMRVQFKSPKTLDQLAEEAKAKTKTTSLTEDPEHPGLRKTLPNGQHEVYIVLSAAERSKGFVRPLRESYIHVGVGGHEVDPSNPAKHGRTGRGCGAQTRMGLALCETYARDPKFYGSTFCVGCKTHLPVGEFVWAEDGAVVGS